MPVAEDCPEPVPVAEDCFDPVASVEEPFDAVPDAEESPSAVPDAEEFPAPVPVAEDCPALVPVADWDFAAPTPEAAPTPTTAADAPAMPLSTVLRFDDDVSPPAWAVFVVRFADSPSVWVVSRSMVCCLLPDCGGSGSGRLQPRWLRSSLGSRR
ncbi:hypothetical protein C451_06295 [Halococcus thailandensis JCM 13552]|uniref:Uncharacterized protein n=1 Tax=Halococcus thailandensis JCM 13552 TaxID=1227457 RepID=M0N9Q1_9EURY|nr:hypothetical protein C451_06295 [Halococcus thailandensis JCM 13552]